MNGGSTGENGKNVLLNITAMNELSDVIFIEIFRALEVFSYMQNERNLFFSNGLRLFRGRSGHLLVT